MPFITPSCCNPKTPPGFSSKALTPEPLKQLCFAIHFHNTTIYPASKWGEKKDIFGENCAKTSVFVGSIFQTHPSTNPRIWEVAKEELQWGFSLYVACLPTPFGPSCPKGQGDIGEWWHVLIPLDYCSGVRSRKKNPKQLPSIRSGQWLVLTSARSPTLIQEKAGG